MKDNKTAILSHFGVWCSFQHLRSQEMPDYSQLCISISAVRYWDLLSVVLSGHIYIATFHLNSNFLQFFCLAYLNKIVINRDF